VRSCLSDGEAIVTDEAGLAAFELDLLKQLVQMTEIIP
jgi:hypothetical protein